MFSKMSGIKENHGVFGKNSTKKNKKASKLLINSALETFYVPGTGVEPVRFPTGV